MPSRLPADQPNLPWEKRDSESPEAYAAFAIYRDQGPGKRGSGRSVTRVVSDLIGSGQYKDSKGTALKRRVGGWSSEHDWVTRVEAYDLEQDRVRRAEDQEAALRSWRRVANESAAARQGLFQYAQAMIRRISDQASRVEVEAELNAKSADELAMRIAATASAYKAFFEIERLARGYSTMDVVVSAQPAEGFVVDEEHMMRVYAALEEAGYRPPGPPDDVIRDE